MPFNKTWLIYSTSKVPTMVVSAVDNYGNSKPIRYRCEEQPLQMCASVINELKMVETKQQTTKVGTIKQSFFWGLIFLLLSDTETWLSNRFHYFTLVLICDNMIQSPKHTLWLASPTQISRISNYNDV